MSLHSSATGSAAPLRLAIILLAHAFASCESAQELADRRLEVKLDVDLVEAAEMVAAQREREVEQADVRERLARLTPMTAAELAALAGPTAAIDWRRAELFLIGSVTRPGGLHDGLELATQVVAAGPGNWLARLSTDGAKVTVGVGLPIRPHRVWVDLSVEPLEPEGSFCFSGCRARRDRIRIKQRRLGEALAQIGDLAALQDEIRALEDLVFVRAFFGGAEWLPALRRLEGASWFPPGSAAASSRGHWELSIPGADARGPAVEAACNATMAPLAHCAWTPRGLVLTLPPPTDGGAGPAE